MLLSSMLPVILMLHRVLILVTGVNKVVQGKTVFFTLWNVIGTNLILTVASKLCGKVFTRCHSKLCQQFTVIV